MDAFLEVTKLEEIESSIYSSASPKPNTPYDKKAKAYEKLVALKLYNKLMWGTLPEDYRTFNKIAILNSKGTSIDLGCGGLVHSAPIYANAKGRFILLDGSLEMLKIAKNRMGKICNKTPENIRFLQANALNVPFQDSTFDSILSFGLIHLFEEKEKFICEVIRLLKPGGKFYISALTSDRKFSKYYMCFLQKQGEIATPLHSEQFIELFQKQFSNLNWYIRGSMLFINGEKTND